MRSPSMNLWNVGILPQHYTASQPRIPRLESYYCKLNPLALFCKLCTKSHNSHPLNLPQFHVCETKNLLLNYFIFKHRYSDQFDEDNERIWRCSWSSRFCPGIRMKKKNQSRQPTCRDSNWIFRDTKKLWVCACSGFDLLWYMLQGLSSRCVKLTTHHHLVRRLRMRESIPPILKYVFIVRCLIKQWMPLHRKVLS
jgi:hypothetical protein